MHGLFIVLEGPDGTGKSTLAKLLVADLRSLGHDVVATREPGGTPLGQKIRELILNSKGPDLGHCSEMLLYAADRAQNISEIVQPALAQGRVVLAERYVDSSLAYQGYGLGWDLEAIRSVNEIATGGLRPHLTILLDPGPHGLEESLSRAVSVSDTDSDSDSGGAAGGAGKKEKGGDRIEKRGTAFYRRVREGYLQLAAQNTDRRYEIVNCHGLSIAELQKILLDIIVRVIAEKSV
ncbi:MAG TPA: dTMP kinase [Firmicutes bacterium]|nr:dTMP kinase [Bacillota bacterium]HAW70051.1 dTMP kinase [Bacillota bacterium]HAZ22858.1 dTMP kinase [Bacillota bacterium]HBE06987.1 dTMP kinase [Bacillota bacterium]HBG43836.1 dTMP kinase [Bacillota bacterium]